MNNKRHALFLLPIFLGLILFTLMWLDYSKKSITPFIIYSNEGGLESEAYLVLQADHFYQDIDEVDLSGRYEYFQYFINALKSNNKDLTGFFSKSYSKSNMKGSVLFWGRYEIKAGAELVSVYSYDNVRLFLVNNAGYYSLVRFQKEGADGYKLNAFPEKDRSYSILSNFVTYLNKKEQDFERLGFFEYMKVRLQNLMVRDLLMLSSSGSGLYLKNQDYSVASQEAKFIQKVMSAYKLDDSQAIVSITSKSDDILMDNPLYATAYLSRKGFNKEIKGCLAFIGEEVFMYLLDDDRGVNLLVKKDGDGYYLLDVSVNNIDDGLINHIKKSVNFEGGCHLKKESDFSVYDKFMLWVNH